MKIIIFNTEREIVDEIENVLEPEPYSSREVRWLQGGIGGIDPENQYVIVNDDQQLADLTEEEIFNQLKYQVKLDLARQYEQERIKALAEGTETEAETRFKKARAEVEAAGNRENVTLAEQRYNQRRPQNNTGEIVAE